MSLLDGEVSAGGEVNDRLDSESDLIRAMESFLGLPLRPAGRLAGGHESDVLLVSSPNGPLVLKVNPRWRTTAELEWVHAVIRRANHSVPCAIQPIHRQGRSLIEWRGRPVSVMPFVEGMKLDRDSDLLRQEAARTLAALHRALLNWPGTKRPVHGSLPKRPIAAPSALVDERLDGWWDAVAANGFLMGVTHGDYYPGNIICHNGLIAGVIDWDEAAVGPLALELAAAAFECCRDDQHNLSISRASGFVNMYRVAGGPLPRGDLDLLVPLMRLWIKRDVESAMANPDGYDSAYVERQVRAFSNLAGVRLA